MANKSKGWVIIDRTICDNEIWKDSEPFDRRSAWIDLILMVNHEKRDLVFRGGQKIEVPRGCTYTSYRHLADRWHWSVGKVQRFLTYLADTLSVTLTGTPSGTLISLIKYGDFQGQRYTNRYTNRYTDGIQTKNERKNERKNSTASCGSGNRPAPYEERMEGIMRLAMQGKEET